MTKKLFLATLICVATTTAATAQSVYKGLRVPQLSTVDRANIGAETNANNAKGQQIFNLTTGYMEYWDGTKWVSLADGDTIIGNEVVDASDVTLTRTGSGTAADPYKLKANVTNIADSIATYFDQYESLKETILNYVTESANIKSIADTIAYNFSNSTLKDTIVTYIKKNSVQSVSSDLSGFYFDNIDAANPVLKINNSPTAGMYLDAFGSWSKPENTSYTADGITIIESGNEFSVGAGGITTDKIADATIAWEDLNKSVTDSIQKRTTIDTIANRGGVTYNKTAANEYEIGLIPGVTTGQILQWNGSRWVLATAASVIKTLTITIDSTYTIESSNYTGKTVAAAAPLTVVGIEPVITATSGDSFIARNLGVSVTAKVVGNAIAYTLRVKNDNIDSSESFTIAAINIFYTCDEEVMAATGPVAEIYVGQ
jgi:hypothetical protein